MGIITYASDPTTVMGIYNSGMAMPMLDPKIYSACSLVCPMPTKIMGTTSATAEFTTLDDARTKVMGTDELTRGAMCPLGDAMRPLYTK